MINDFDNMSKEELIEVIQLPNVTDTVCLGALTALVLLLVTP